MKNDSIEIFIGSDIEANYISSLLTDNQIKCFVQNRLEGSLSAGWVSGSAFNSSVIYVNINDIEKAKEIIKEYTNNETIL